LLALILTPNILYFIEKTLAKSALHIKEYILEEDKLAKGQDVSFSKNIIASKSSSAEELVEDFVLTCKWKLDSTDATPVKPRQSRRLKDRYI